MTLKLPVTDHDDRAFQTTLRARRTSVPSAASVVASQLHEQLGLLSDAVSELARKADAGDVEADRMLLVAEDEVYQLLAESRQLIERKDGGR